MKSTKRRALYVIAALLGTLFILACLAGFAACGGSSDDDCADGHTVTSWTTTKDATCTEAGSRTGVCDVCGETVTETISALGHNWVSGTVVEATCKEGGYTPQTCSRCGATQQINQTEKTTEHTWDTGEVTTAATCTTDGEMTYTCTVCGETKTETIEATGHTWNDGVVTTEPTIYADGEMTYTCTACGETKTEPIEKLTPGDYTSNFLTGDLSGVDESYVTYTNWKDSTLSAKFAGSEISVEFDTTSNSEQYQYVVSGTAAVMNETQLKAFWGTDGAEAHANAQYITIAFVANAGESFTIKSNKSSSGLQIDGDAVDSDGQPDKDSTFYTLVYDVSNWSEENKGETVFTITDKNEDEYPVVIGDIELFTVVSTESDLRTALTEGGEIALAGDIDITSALEVSADTELDLEGNTLSTGESWTAETRSSGNVSDVMISVGKGANLTIEDTSEDGSGKIDYSYSNSDTASAWGTTYNWNSAGNHGAAIMVDGDETTSVTIESGDIETTSVGIRAKNGDIVINGGTIHSTGFYVIWEDTGTTSVTINDGKVSGDWGGILVDGDSNFKGEGSYGTGAKTTLTVNGGKIYSGGTKQAAIRTENKTSTDSAYIEINGGKITCADNGGTKNEAAIYLANGTLKVTDGVITGPTALEVQAGKATVEGGKFVAKYGENNASQNVNTTSSSSDPFTYGYSLAVYPRANVTRTDIDNFSMAVDVTVTGGTFDGDVLVSEVIYGQNSPTEGWILNATDSNYKVSISGITATAYSEAGIRTIVAFDDSTVILGNDIALSSTLEISTTITLDLNGNTLSTDDNWTATPASNGVISDVMISVTKDGSLTIMDSSDDQSGAIDYKYSDKNGTTAWGNSYTWSSAGDHGAVIKTEGTVVINGGTIETTSVGIRAQGGDVTINGGVIYSTGFYVIWEDVGEVTVTINGGFVGSATHGILVDGDSNFKGGYGTGAVTKLIVKGGVIYSGDLANSAIRTENWTTTDSAYIEINGGIIYCADAEESDKDTYEAGIFIGNGTLKITGGVIIGPTAVEIQGGKATISGGVFISNATGDQSVVSTDHSDPFSYGYALTIYPRVMGTRSDNTPISSAVDVTITGGTFYGDIYVSYEPISNSNYTTSSSDWAVKIEYIETAGDDEDETGENDDEEEAEEEESGNYVVKIDNSLEITLTPYDSSGNPITAENSDTAVDH